MRLQHLDEGGEGDVQGSPICQSFGQGIAKHAASSWQLRGFKHWLGDMDRSALWFRFHMLQHPVQQGILSWSRELIDRSEVRVSDESILARDNVSAAMPIAELSKLWRKCCAALRAALFPMLKL